MGFCSGNKKLSPFFCYQKKVGAVGCCGSEIMENQHGSAFLRLLEVLAGGVAFSPLVAFLFSRCFCDLK